MPCETTEFTPLWGVCLIGAVPDTAESGMALIGDSHAAHLRAAFQVIGAQRGITVSNIWRAGCPFTTLPPVLGRQRSRDCVTWSKHVVSWLARVASQPGKSPFEAKVSGYEAAMRSLPNSVTHIVVVRDPPNNPRTSSSCVANAFAGRKEVGDLCWTRRAKVLRPNAQVAAAARVRSRQVDVVDLTPLMCDREFCMPVVGGVLVHKDGDHLSTTFAATMAPYIDRALGRIRPRIEGFGRSAL